MSSRITECRRLAGSTLGLLLVALMFSSSAALGQEQPPPPPTPPPGPPAMESRLETMMEALTDELKLSDAQAGQVREILAERMHKQRELFEKRREEDRSSRMEMRDSMMKLREEGDARIKALLDDEQAAAYDQFMKERGPRRGMRGRRPKM